MQYISETNLHIQTELFADIDIYISFEEEGWGLTAQLRKSSKLGLKSLHYLTVKPEDIGCIEDVFKVRVMVQLFFRLLISLQVTGIWLNYSMVMMIISGTCQNTQNVSCTGWEGSSMMSLNHHVYYLTIWKHTEEHGGTEPAFPEAFA